MKIRINGNSVRYRLSKSEVEKLAADGYLESHATFGTQRFIYAIEETAVFEKLSAAFKENKITVYAPMDFLKTWADSQTIGLDATIRYDDGETLYLLIEKDFKCIDNTSEDQSDNYDNPKAVC
ncbi:hypothetical protein DYBT9275_03230 [Dyadobacter sp. CECT 9275]|uniref:Uncharacterized protein n=1 Tax=Dyadobacter helix TaxID=2822344 RepID=A0A916JH87_9BACT|nr:hypothetical protein [Dyadobacter sp. CECT 9275]CAG5003791.1 hypothetical protein DYBT9275_03230 [Dyadobacter sp. CECT 9275]